jgi:L-fuconolactonase
MRDGLFICDAQVHTPDVANPAGHVRGMDPEPLVAEMDTAGVDRAIIVPLATKQDEADNGPALDVARRHPDRFRVMGLVDPADPSRAAEGLREMGDADELLGIRVSCFRDWLRSMLVNEELDWLWKAAIENDLPVMLYAPDMPEQLKRTATAFPDLRIIVDHLGLRPRHVFADISEPVAQIAELARCDNVAVKATSLPTSVEGPYPFRGAHEGLRMAVEAFGPDRVFWGSDITRLPCTYTEAVAMFTDELPFLTRSDLELIMGRGLCTWLGWAADAEA